jgi:hypothetical protein
MYGNRECETRLYEVRDVGRVPFFSPPATCPKKCEKRLFIPFFHDFYRVFIIILVHQSLPVPVRTRFRSTPSLLPVHPVKILAFFLAFRKIKDNYP